MGLSITYRRLFWEVGPAPAPATGQHCTVLYCGNLGSRPGALWHHVSTFGGDACSLNSTDTINGGDAATAILNPGSPLPFSPILFCTITTSRPRTQPPRRAMPQWPLPRSFMMDDEEMAKKNDDLPRSRQTRTASWQHTSKPHALRRSSAGRFIVYTLLFIFAIYVYGQSRGGGIYYEDGETPLRGGGRFVSQHRGPGGAGYGFDDSLDLIDDRKHDMSKNKPKHKGQGKGKTSGQATVPEPVYFTGPIQFPRLAMSLRASGSSGGRNPRNRNVLIAASSLRAVANLLPFACQMASDELSSMHVAVMSRSEVPIKDLLAINGVTEECNIRVHGTSCVYD